MQALQRERRKDWKFGNDLEGPSRRLFPSLDAAVERMRAARVKAILVTSGKGRLLGVVNRDDGERLVKEREGHSRTAESVT